jgi:hypothetical protein
MGEKPPYTSLDRINNDGDYEPSNCRWSTITQQNGNTRRNRPITFNGHTMNLNEWAVELGISYGTLYRRIVTNKWPIEKALTHKRTLNLRAEAKALGIPYMTHYSRWRVKTLGHK